MEINSTIHHQNIQTIKCLLCLANSGEFISVSDEQGKTLNITNILLQHFWFDIKEFGDSKHICTSCWTSVFTFHTFYLKIYEIHHSTYVEINPQENVYQPIIENLKEEENNDVNKEFLVLVSLPEKNENLKSVKNEINMIEDENNCNQVEDNCEYNNMTENNVVDDENTCDNMKFEVKIDDNDDDDDVVGDEEDEDEDDDDEIDDKLIKNKKRKSNKNKLNDELDDLKSQKRKNSAKITKEQIAEEDRQIREFFQMNCQLCSEVFPDFLSIQCHYRNVHNKKGFVTCCNKKFFLRVRAAEHVEFHINPDAFRCKICQKSYTNKSGLLNHMDSHVPGREKPYKCESCPKEFAKKYQLQQHQIRHVPDEEKSFRCDECGKTFAKNSILKSHKRSVHENAYLQICEICGKYLKTKMFYEQHCRIAHSEVALPKVQCPQCGLWLKHESSYRKHMLLHEDEKRTHICDLCGKQSPNGRALHIHKKRVHFSERTHKCNLCGKAFKRATSLKEHMATHTGEILYTCPHCPKTFNSGANMHSHRKKMHRKEWEENRLNRFIS